MAAGGDPAVVAMDQDLVAVAFDGLSPGTLVEADAAAQKVGFEGSSHFRVLSREDLLATDQQSDVTAKRREHVNELHTGDAGADHDQVVGHLTGRVSLAGGENALAVDGPSRGCEAGYRC